jgi:hypothetical protein
MASGYFALERARPRGRTGTTSCSLGPGVEMQDQYDATEPVAIQFRSKWITIDSSPLKTSLSNPWTGTLFAIMCLTTIGTSAGLNWLNLLPQDGFLSSRLGELVVSLGLFVGLASLFLLVITIGFNLFKTRILLLTREVRWGLPGFRRTRSYDDVVCVQIVAERSKQDGQQVRSRRKLYQVNFVFDAATEQRIHFCASANLSQTRVFARQIADMLQVELVDQTGQGQ